MSTEISKESEAMDYSAMLQRVVRAVTFDMRFYSEARNDVRLDREVLIIVIVSALVGALGSLTGGLLAFLLAVVMGIAGYYLLSYFITIAGRNFFAGEATQEQVQRLLGYSWAPLILGILGFLPCVGWLVSLVATLWSLAVAVVAVREAMGFGTARAIIIVVSGGLILVILTRVLGVILGVGWVGLGVLG